MTWKYCLLYLIKQNRFLKTFLETLNLDDSGISLLVLPSRTNLKLHNISIAPRLVKKVITNLDLWSASGADWIQVVVLKNCEPNLSYVLATLFNMCLKESCFPDSWQIMSVVPMFMLGKGVTAKTYRFVNLLSVVSMSLKNL